MCQALATRDQAIEWVESQGDLLTTPSSEDPGLGPWQRRLVEATALLVREALVHMGKQMPTSGSPCDLAHPDASIQMSLIYPSPLADNSSSAREEGKRVSISISMPPQAYPYRGKESGAAAYVHVSAPLEKLQMPGPLLKAALDGTLFDAMLAQSQGVFNIPLDENIVPRVQRYLQEGSAWFSEFEEKKMDMALPDGCLRTSLIRL